MVCCGVGGGSGLGTGVHAWWIHVDVIKEIKKRKKKVKNPIAGKGGKRW